MDLRQARLIQQVQSSAERRESRKRIGTAMRLVWHAILLLIAVACFAAYGHLKVEGRTTAAMTVLIVGAVCGFAPLRDVLRLVFRIEGTALHIAHGLGALGLVGLPVSGVVSGTPIFARSWRAPFAIMGAAQAIMHQNQPRNAKQAAALQTFAASLPEVAQFANSKDPISPANAKRAVAVLADIIGKAQLLGETELDGDPGFQGALRHASTRFGASLGLDAVDLALRNLAGNPAAASAVPALQRRLAQARQTIDR
jgi:tryptophan-rich sensory protein